MKRGVSRIRQVGTGEVYLGYRTRRQRRRGRKSEYHSPVGASMTEQRKYDAEEQARDMERLRNVEKDVYSVRSEITGKGGRGTLGLPEIASLLARAPEDVESFWKALAIGQARQPEDRRLVQQHLSRRGWYLSERFSTSDVALLAQHIETRPDVDVDEFLCSHVRDDCDAIEGRLTGVLPRRGPIFRELAPYNRRHRGFRLRTRTSAHQPVQYRLRTSQTLRAPGKRIPFERHFTIVTIRVCTASRP